jgi:hypothetical protein
VFQYLSKKDSTPFQDIEFFKDTRLSVVDEISFAGYDVALGGITRNLKAFTECQEYIYGKHAICFLGDPCQLEGLGGNCMKPGAKLK